MLELMGWRVRGEIPNERQLVICGAPHTSNWDFVIAMFTVMALGVRFSYLMKKEAFYWPFKTLFIVLGGIPVDRNDTEDIVGQITRWYRDHDQVWLAITPEGTRSKVEKWKTGFLRIAYQVNVPVLLVAWHYPEKTLYLDKLWRPSGDHVRDADEIKHYINNRFVGAKPEKQ